MATDDPALRFMDLRVVLRQWARMSPEALSRDPVMRAGLVVLALRAFEEPELVMAVFAENDLLTKQILMYILWEYPDVTEDDVIEHFGRARGTGDTGKNGKMDVEEFVESILERKMAEGEAHGIAMGRVEGLAEGKGKSLMRLLERRFGTLSPDVRERIAGANLDQLDRWFDLAMDADSLGAVFGD